MTPQSSRKFIEWRGVQMIEGWPERIQAAQLVRSYALADGAYDRIPFGSERPDWGGEVCHDCRVQVGELHVEGCDAEECPRCHGQAINCDCERVEP